MNCELQMTNDERAPGSKRASRFAISARHSSIVIRHCLPLALLFAPHAVQACSVCFGNNDSKMSQGMMAGVLVLLLVVLSVLGGFAALFVFLARKAAAAAALEHQSTESKV